MRARSIVPALLVFLLGAALAAAPVGAQGLNTSLGAGIASPVGDFGDLYDPGFTVRGQVGLDLVLLDVHAQAGWSRFGAADADTDDANVTHLGVGARAGFGLFWVGLNAAQFWGEGDDGVGWVPEVGVSFLSLEAVADVRIDGDEKWWALRGALRF